MLYLDWQKQLSLWANVSKLYDQSFQKCDPHWSALGIDSRFLLLSPLMDSKVNNQKGQCLPSPDSLSQKNKNKWCIYFDKKCISISVGYKILPNALNFRNLLLETIEVTIMYTSSLLSFCGLCLIVFCNAQQTPNNIGKAIQLRIYF